MGCNDLEVSAGFQNLYEGAQTDRIYNWSKINPIALKTQIRRLKTEEDIRDLLVGIPDNSKVRPIGSCLSYEQITTLPLDDPHSVVADLSQMEGLVYMDEMREEATFWGGSRVEGVIKVLSERNYQMQAAPGVIGIQTLAGAVATGTHGQGLGQSSYGDTVVRIRLVLANGDVVVVGKEENEELKEATRKSLMSSIPAVHRPDLPLEAFTLSLGLLGIITQLTIKIISRKVYLCRKIDTSFEDLAANYLSWNRANEHIKAWWFADSNTCQVWLTNTISNEEAERFLQFTDKDKAPLELGDANTEINTTVDRYLRKMERDTLVKFEGAKDIANGSGIGSKKLTYFDTVTRFANSRDSVGYIDQLLCKGIPAPQINCEIAIPCTEFPGALEDLHDWTGKSKDLHYPIILRATGKSNSWLAQSQEESVHIGSLVYVSDSGTVRADAMKIMREFQEILVRHKGIPHLGKHFAPEVFNANFRNQKIYPHVRKFFELRKQLDPRKKLLSAFLEEIWADFV